MTYVIAQVAVGSLKVYLYGIRDFCLARGQADPLRNYHVERCWRGIKRLKKRGKDKRLTLTVNLLLRATVFAMQQISTREMGPRDRHNLTVICTIMVWGVVGLFRIGELVVSGPRRYARVLRRYHCTRCIDDGEEFLRINLDGSKTDPFRGGLDAWLGSLDDSAISPLFWHSQLEATSVSVGLNRGKAQAMFRWADGQAVAREQFVKKARDLLAAAGIDDGSSFNGISLRRGGAKSLKDAGAGDLAIMRAGRWTSDCFRRYIDTPRNEILLEQRGLLDLVRG